ncbi:MULTISPECIES: fimbrial protein [unclassified Caballeronia]|uniref:fimbrial protein n=1 Tax=unclassified Caballeronia TaxID=2646786 RepID=UPI00285EDA1D|nr:MULTISPECIES: fimbrial protein [unclassified Caballeronia]MDR5753575.1 fimbrial protein [Caballeronia sp. LZ024]MDR5839954.1 fimbrial protein [Caballeronia sp. LZ031]
MFKVAAWIFTVVLTLLWGSTAHATLNCGVQNGNQTLNVGYISVPRNASPGQTVTTLAPQPFVMSCSFDTRSPQILSGTLIATFKTNTAPVAGMPDVYPTSIAGLGVRYRISSAACTEQSVVITNQSGTLNCPRSGSAIGDSVPIAATFTAEFVVTGTLAGGAVPLTSVPSIPLNYQTSVESGSWSQTPILSGTATGTIRQQSCSVMNSAQAITLPTVTTRSLTGVAGTVAGATPLSLNLSCAAGAQVSITFTDATSPANTTTVLSLAAGSTATGVGIELRRAGDVKIGYGPDSAAPGTTNQWLVGAAPNGALSIPLFVRYVRSTGPLASGLVKALATFTMSYN